MSEVVYIARCPVHGLHGCRTRCYECGGEVEQVPMVALPVSDELVERAADAVEASFRFGGYPNTRMPGTESVDCREVARIALQAALTSGDEA